MGAIRTTLVVALAMFALAACNSGGGKGVGTDLYTSALPENTHLQDQYITDICAQAGGSVIQLADSVDCNAPGGWSSFVQAGMNDIDNRCDAYLVWLDQQKRNQKPILDEISAVGTTTGAILDKTDAGAKAIFIVAQAFGIAVSTFTNVNAGLLLEMDHSTVQAVVLGRQADFRNDILGKPVSDRPTAIYVLRSYLRICMPMTIATDINTTISALERTNKVPDALVDGDVVARTLVSTPNSPVNFLPPPPTKSFLETLQPGHVKDVQAALCAKNANLAGTVAAVHDFLVGRQSPSTKWTIETDKLIPVDSDCATTDFQNAYEVGAFGVPSSQTEMRIKVLQEELQQFFVAVKDSSVTVAVTGKLDKPTRDAIQRARGDLPNLGNPGPDRAGQMDQALYLAILKVTEGGG